MADLDLSFVDRAGVVDAVAKAVTIVELEWITLTNSILNGDFYASAIAITGATGSQTFSTLGALREADEPLDAAGNNTAGTIWFKYTAPSTGNLTVGTSTTPTDVDTVVEVYDDAALNALTLLGFADDISGSDHRSTVTVPVGSGLAYYVRVHNKTSAVPPRNDNALSWSLAARTGETTGTTTTLPESPGIVQVSYSGGVPDDTITVNLVGYGSNPLTTSTLDDTGQASLSVPIPASTTAGTHTLELVTSSGTTNVSLEVQAEASTPSPPPAGTPPTPVVTTRWVLEDVGPGGITYTFPNNPSRMSSPHPPRTITAEHTTSPAGQRLLWEGAARPYSWEFAGYCGTEDFYNKLKLFVDINRRFYLTDHRSRQWVVTFDYFDAQPRNDINNYWAHDYTMRATIYGGPL